MPAQKQLAVSRPIGSMFGPAPILEGEDSEAYSELLVGVSNAIKPADSIEDMWVHDIVNWTWEILRYRRYKARLLKAALPKALEEVLAPFVNGRWRFGAMDVYEADGALKPTTAMEIVNDWIRGDAKAIKRVDEVLREGKLTMEDVEARAMTISINKMEQYNRLLSPLESRRNAVLREIEHRRAVLAQRLRRVMRNAEDAEFEEVDSKAITLQNG